MFIGRCRYGSGSWVIGSNKYKGYPEVGWEGVHSRIWFVFGVDGLGCGCGQMWYVGGVEVWVG